MNRTVIAILLGLAVPLPSHAQRAFSRPAMLEAMARNSITSGLNELDAYAAKLSRAAQELQEHPTSESLAATQQAWVSLYLAYKRRQMLSRGPVKDEAFWAATFFPQPFPKSVENVIRDKKPITLEYLDVLGSLAKGFFAIEYLIFDAPGPGAILGGAKVAPRLSVKLLLEGPTAKRRRDYVRELARDVEKRLHDASTEAQAAGFPAKFVAGGQESINLLVNQVIVGLEMGLIFPLENYNNQMQTKRLRSEMIEGLASGTSLAGMKAALEGVYQYYLGGQGMGVDDYIRHVNPELSLEAAFKSTAASLDAITTPLEEAITRNPAAVQRVIDEARKLEILCKVDVVAALGVTVMFNANDGD